MNWSCSVYTFPFKFSSLLCTASSLRGWSKRTQIKEFKVKQSTAGGVTGACKPLSSTPQIQEQERDMSLLQKSHSCLTSSFLTSWHHKLFSGFILTGCTFDSSVRSLDYTLLKNPPSQSLEKKGQKKEGASVMWDFTCNAAAVVS